LTFASFANANLAHAEQALALVHTRATGTEQLATLAPFSANPLSAPGTALPACCRYVAGVSAFDPVGDRLYAVAIDDTGNESLQRFDRRLGATSTLALPAGTHVLALAWQISASRLVGLQRVGAAHRVVVIDPGTGTVTPLSGVITDCCIVRGGVAALHQTSATFAFVARAPTSEAWEIFRVALSNGSVKRATTFVALDALAYDDEARLLGTYLDTQSALYRIAAIGNTGAAAPFGPGLAACCAVQAGASYLLDGELVLLARDVAGTLGDSRLGLVAFSIRTGTTRTLGIFGAGTIVDALAGTVPPNIGPPPVGPDAIFKDSFE
jgi:hypothetical protein